VGAMPVPPAQPVMASNDGKIKKVIKQAARIRPRIFRVLRFDTANITPNNPIACS